MDAAEACLIVRLPGLRAGVCARGQVMLHADLSVFPSCPVCEAQVTEEVRQQLLNALAQYWRLERPGQFPRAASVPVPGFLRQP